MLATPVGTFCIIKKAGKKDNRVSMKNCYGNYHATVAHSTDFLSCIIR